MLEIAAYASLIKLHYMCYIFHFGSLFRLQRCFRAASGHVIPLFSAWLDFAIRFVQSSSNISNKRSLVATCFASKKVAEFLETKQKAAQEHAVP